MILAWGVQNMKRKWASKARDSLWLSGEFQPFAKRKWILGSCSFFLENPAVCTVPILYVKKFSELWSHACRIVKGALAPKPQRKRSFHHTWNGKKGQLSAEYLALPRIFSVVFLYSTMCREDGLFMRVVSEWEFHDVYKDREDCLVALKVKYCSIITLWFIFCRLNSRYPYSIHII